MSGLSNSCSKTDASKAYYGFRKGITGDEHKALLAYVALYLNDIESKLLN